MISDQNKPKTSSQPPRKQKIAQTKAASRPSAPSSTAVAQRPDQASTVSTSVAQARNTAPGEPAGPKQPALKSQGKAAAQSRGTLLTKPEDILRHELGTTEGAKEKYAALNEEQRAQFDKLVLSQVVEGTEVNTAPKPRGGMGGSMARFAEMTEQERAAHREKGKGTAARHGLISLLAGGKLSDKDGDCDTLLTNLTQLQEQPMAEGRDREALFRGVVHDSAFAPGQGGNIAAGELNKTLARDNPGEYARVIGALASPDGSAKLGAAELKGTNPSEELNTQNPMGFGQSHSSSSQLFQGSISENTAREELFRLDVIENSERGADFAKLSLTDQQKFQTVYQETMPEGDHPKMPARQGMGMGMGMGIGAMGTGPKASSEPADPARIAEQKKAMDDFNSQSQAVRSGQQARTGLTNLLQEGTLSNKDSQGRSLIDNLHSIRQQDMASENGHTLSGKEIMSEVINQIDDPGSIRQNNKGTCTVTTVEHLLATRQPSEYARVIGQLTDKSGSVTLQDGASVPREKGIVAPDDSMRSNSSRIFQASMMEYGNGASKDYRNAEDGHYKAGTGEAILDSKGKVSSGLYSAEWEKVSDSVLGTDSEVRRGTLQGANRRDIQADISQALAGDRTVQVAMRWSTDEDGKHGHHALSVTGQDDEYVYLRNPWGTNDQGSTDSSSTVAREVLRPADQGRSSSGGIGFGGFRGFGMGDADTRPVANPDHSTGEGGSIRVTKDEFYGKLSDYLVEEKPQTESPSWFERLNPF